MKGGIKSRGSSKIPDYGSGGNNSLQNMIIAQSLLPEKLEQQKKAKIQEETELAPLERQRAEQKKIGERVVETAPSRAIMKGTLIKSKRLADTVTPPPAGIDRLIKGASLAWKGNVTQELPQINEYNKNIDAALTAFARAMYAEKGNVANWDIERVKKAFSSIEWDTADARALSWNRAIDTYNDVMRAYSGVSGGFDPTIPKGEQVFNPLEELIEKREMMSPYEIGRSRYLSGESIYDDLSDEELAAISEGPMNIVPSNIHQKYIEELKKRGA